MLTGLALASTLGACSSYQVVTAPLPQYLDAHAGAGDLRVTLISGERVAFQGAYVVGDSLLGYAPDATATEYWPVSVPLGAVREARVRKAHASKTVGLLVGGALVVGTVVASIGLSSVTGSMERGF
jgi:hypothetical protein